MNIEELRKKSCEVWADARRKALHEAYFNAPITTTAAAAGAAGSGGGGNRLPSNAIEFVVNTFDDLNFEFDFTSTEEPITFTINWGDGETYDGSGGGGYYPESHRYAEVADYTVRVSFDDPLKILQLNFPGDGLAVIKSIRGLQNLANLQDFRADWNALETIDFSGLENLAYIDISDCDFVDSNEASLSEVILTGCINLKDIRIDDSNFSNGFPDFTGLDKLTYFDADQSNISGSLDLSFLPNLQGFDLSGNLDLTEVIISSNQTLGYNESVYIYDCNLTKEAVDNILVTLSTNGESNGYVDLSGGTNSPPSSTGLAAKTILEENGWTVDINEPLPLNVSIAPSTDFDIVGNFTIEMFVKFYNLDNFLRLYSFGVYPAANAISVEGGQLYFWGNNGIVANTAFTPNLGQWYHIAIQRKEGNIDIFIDGVTNGSTAYSNNIPSQGLPLTIGFGNEANSSFNGLMTNFRWSTLARYNTEGFTVPTTPFTTDANTTLLLFQGTTLPEQLTDNSGNGHNGTGDKLIYRTDNPLIGIEGSTQLGLAVTSYPYMFADSETSSAQACSRLGTGSALGYLNDTVLTTGKFIYLDSSLTNPFPAGWYAYINTAYQVNSNGEIVAIESC